MKIVMTGGGTAGHVTPNIALFPHLKKMGFEIHYIGTKKGMERELIEREGIPYHTINAGKLRRYFDLKNVTDVLRIGQGFFQALTLVRKLKPDVVFSKGGFVSCPVAWAAWINKIPVIIHESDFTPGLANKLAMPFADKICYTFPETKKYIKADKGVLTGIPVRDALLAGSPDKGRKLCGFTEEKPTLLVIGGSLGAGVINSTVRDGLHTILKRYQLCHICGKGGTEASLDRLAGYKQFEYVNEDLPHLFAMADVIISRAGATVLYELLALKKPNLLIPLSKSASRGDQILNARSFERQGYSSMLVEEDMNTKTLIDRIDEVYKKRYDYASVMSKCKAGSGVDTLLDVIVKSCRN
jgi:UDP-N-acetylglucosamine--N-acetylmuramyl-(pentapeptide) pyrophosphoryl-undecaprenol N-acetylglucosamine transferase